MEKSKAKSKFRFKIKTIMAFQSKMKMFESTRKYLAILGIKKYPPSRKHPFNKLNIVIMNTLTSACISTILYLIYSRDTINIQEYMISIYTAFTTFINVLLYAILIWKSSKVFVLLEGIESVIQESE